MSRRKRHNQDRANRRRQLAVQRRQNRVVLQALLGWLIPGGALFPKSQVHGNAKWSPEELAVQAVIWAWQEATFVTDAFTVALEICDDLKLEHVAKTYTAFLNALERYDSKFGAALRRRLHILAEEVAGRFWRDGDWVLMAFDGSRTTAPRTVSNERAFCAPNYGQGTTAKYRKKKSKGMRRRRNEKNKPYPQAPQVWITMFWHMSLRLPWTWQLGPSNSSEREHVKQILEQEKFPKDTLFCGDAGFVGYDLWKAILDAHGHFLVRVGANVSLLSEHADIQQLKDDMVLCWPKGKMESGEKPLRLRLVRVKIGKTRMWMLTSVLDKKSLPISKIIRFYKMRWGVEVEYRGLKQTLDKHNLRCRNSARVYVELDWSIRAMAFAELIALREQIPRRGTRTSQTEKHYDTRHRSLAATIRALRECMRNVNKYADLDHDLLLKLARALVQRYRNRTDKKSRYRRRNPDKKPLGEPRIRKLTRVERQKLRELGDRAIAA